MIEFNQEKSTYVCPYCGCKQAYSRDNSSIEYATYRNPFNNQGLSNELGLNLQVYHILCNNFIFYTKKSVCIAHTPRKRVTK